MLRKSNRSKKVNLGGAICLLAMIYFIYYLLIEDKLFPLSISSIFTWSHGISKQWQILIIGLIPIYLALMIFGTAVASLFVGSALQRWLLPSKFKKKDK